MPWPKKLFSGWSVPGWVVLLTVGAIELLDWADRLASAKDKLIAIMPTLHPIIDFLASGVGRLTILIVGLVLVFVSTWRKHNRTPVSKHLAVETEKPKLAGVIESVGSGDWPVAGGNPTAFVIIQATIANLGSPSIAKDYVVYLHRGEQRTKFKPHVLTRPNPIDANPDAALFEKTETPINRGARVRGFLWVTFPGITHAQYEAEGCKVEIEFKDVEEKTYNVIQGPSHRSDGTEVYPKIGNPIGDALRKAKPPS